MLSWPTYTALPLMFLLNNKKMHLWVTFNYITYVFCCGIRCPTSDIKDISVNFNKVEVHWIFCIYSSATVQNWGWSYIFIRFARKWGLDKMANKTDNTLYSIYSLTASWNWCFLSLSITMTWWRSHYPAECSLMFSQLWRGLMWAFSYIQLPLEEAATWGNWAVEWVRKSNCWNDRKAIQFNFAFGFAKQVHRQHLKHMLKYMYTCRLDKIIT